MKLIVDMTNAKVWSFATSSKGTVDIHFDGPVTFHTEVSQPSDQPRETCKWKRERIDGDLMCWSPHREDVGKNPPMTDLEPFCPTCGLRIEVVE